MALPIAESSQRSLPMMLSLEEAVASALPPCRQEYLADQNIFKEQQNLSTVPPTCKFSPVVSRLATSDKQGDVAARIVANELSAAWVRKI